MSCLKLLNKQKELLAMKKQNRIFSIILSLSVLVTCLTVPTSTVATVSADEAYELYDEITFDDLYCNSESMASKTIDGGNRNYTYSATSPTYSTIFRFRWTPTVSDPQFAVFFDDWVYPFCFAAKAPYQSGFGPVPGANGGWQIVPSNWNSMVEMDTPIVIGNHYDMELGRLKVKTGANTGKYYVFWKVNGVLITSYYYGGVSNGIYENGTALSNKIIFGTANGQFSGIPVPETYEEYDEVGFDDLYLGDISLSGLFLAAGSYVCTYNATSPTYSTVFKLRWTAGGTELKCRIYFDGSVYPFCFAVKTPNQSGFGKTAGPNGAWHLVPSNGSLMVDMDTPIVAGNTYDMELGRLKVKTGANMGKYYVYWKVNNQLIQSYYYGDVSNGTYENGTVLSNKILIDFPNGNRFSAISGLTPGDEPQEIDYTHQGTRGDFDGNAVINANDLVLSKSVLLGQTDLGKITAEMTDFNNDGNADVRDLVSMKKHLIPATAYAKSGSLVVGIQEHMFVDATKTPEYIADASATLGAQTYRLSLPIHYMYRATVTNDVEPRTDWIAKFRTMVDELKENGINEILYVSSEFVQPYGYDDPTNVHAKTVPNPMEEQTNYENWLKVNAAAFREFAKEFPEVKYFEPYNEINVDQGSHLEKYGVNPSFTEAERAAYKYTVEERAGIMADLCWYISQAVKSVDRKNQVTTPSISFNVASHVENNFLETFYSAMESGNHPRGRACGDVNTDNYFTILNIHYYKGYSSTNADIDSSIATIESMYDVVLEHNDAEKRVWLTETGCASAQGRTKVGENIVGFLNAVDTRLTYIDTVHLYELAEDSTTSSENEYGVFRSGLNPTDPYGIKDAARALYSYWHNGLTDYSALYALVSRYAE